MRRMIAVIVSCLALTTPARAQAPVAVIEDAQGKVTGAEFMDYVVPGQVIKLGPGGSIVLSYMKSCWHETISGVGTVIVGTEQSAVHLAEFKAGKEKAFNSLVGKVMAASKGKANPAQVNAILKRKLR